MQAREILTAIIIHLGIPIMGLIYFLILAKKMKNENIETESILELFIVFATYGGLLIVVLTTYFWYWSGMASLGTFYLILCAPIVMGIIAFRNRNKRKNEKFYTRIYKAGIFYFVIAPITFLILYLTTKP